MTFLRHAHKHLITCGLGTE